MRTLIEIEFTCTSDGALSAIRYGKRSGRVPRAGYLLLIRLITEMPGLRTTKKDEKKRSLFLVHELERLFLKTLMHNQRLRSNNYSRMLFYNYPLFWKLRRNSRTRVKNYCFITGRSRGVFKLFGLSRHHICYLAARGEIFGFRKASW